jgi:F-box and WD-40 domain protein CDC4
LSDDQAWKALCEKHAYRRTSMESSPTSPLQGSQAIFDYSQDASVESQDPHFLKASEHMKSLKKLKQPTSHRSHFKHKFLVEAAWRKGGVMTARHITPEQGGVVTSLHLTKKYIIVALDNSKIHVFNVKGDHQRTLSGHSGGVWAMVPWGDILVSGGCDREVRVWNMATG